MTASLTCCCSIKLAASRSEYPFTFTLPGVNCWVDLLLDTHSPASRNCFCGTQHKIHKLTKQAKVCGHTKIAEVALSPSWGEATSTQTHPMVYMMVQRQVTLHLSNVTFYKFGRHGFIKSMPAKRLTDPPPWWWYLLCVCAVCCGLVWPLSCVVCKQVPKHNPKVRLCVLLCGPHRLAPYRLSCSATAVFLVYRVFAASPACGGYLPGIGSGPRPWTQCLWGNHFSVCGDPNYRPSWKNCEFHCGGCVLKFHCSWTRDH